MHRCRHCPSYRTSCRGRPRSSATRTRSQLATQTFSSSCRASAAARQPGIGATPIASSGLATRTAASRPGKLTGWDAPCASMLRMTQHSCTGQALRCVTSAPRSKQITNRGSPARRQRPCRSRRLACRPYLPCYNRACRPAPRVLRAPHRQHSLARWSGYSMRSTRASTSVRSTGDAMPPSRRTHT